MNFGFFGCEQKQTVRYGVIRMREKGRYDTVIDFPCASRDHFYLFFIMVGNGIIWWKFFLWNMFEVEI